MIAELDDNGTTPEDANPALQTWEFHDLLFTPAAGRGATITPWAPRTAS